MVPLWLFDLFPDDVRQHGVPDLSGRCWCCVPAGVVKILQEQDGLEDVEFTNDTSLTDLGLDSLAIVEATMACEDEFGIEFDVDEAPETVGDLVDMIDSLL